MGIQALSIAASGGYAMQRHIDVIANNLANVNTASFKRERADFADLFYQQFVPPGSAAANGQAPVGIQQGTGVKLVSTTRSFEPGHLDNTNRQLDWAIEGDGFFRLDNNGIPVYTRAGSFHRDKEGSIVTSRGLKLDPPITVPQNITDVSITSDGRVLGHDPLNPNQQQELGRIQIVRFVNPNGLRALGDNLFEGNEDSAGTPIEGNPGDAGLGIIRDGFLEQSNVDVIREMVDLIQAQRAFEINMNSIKAGDEILQTVNNLRR